MKLCPKCGLNWIEDKEVLCSVCDQYTESITHRGDNVGGRKHPAVYFKEMFTIKSQMEYYRGKQGFQAYNSKGEKVGIIFMSDDLRTPAYGHCELCIYPAYQNQYGEWHRILSHGGRFKWDKLCELLSQRDEYKMYID